jgi:starvation-inducible DNA-binding protein
MPEVMQPHLGTSESSQQAVIDLLNHVLADEHVLYVRLRNYHWNVVGPNFHSLHEMFEEQYNQIAPEADTVAERVRALGGRAIGTMAEFVEYARLREEPGEWPDARQMLSRLVEDHETIHQHLRQDVETCLNEHGDQATADLLIDLMKMHSKMAWMLRATLEGHGAE